MSAVLRLTTPTRLVLIALLANPEREWYGGELIAATHLQTVTVYMILARLRRHGWLTSRWERKSPETGSRPLRRYVRLTDAGAEQARQALERRSGPSTESLNEIRPSGHTRNAHECSESP